MKCPHMRWSCLCTETPNCPTAYESNDKISQIWPILLQIEAALPLNDRILVSSFLVFLVHLVIQVHIPGDFQLNWRRLWSERLRCLMLLVISRVFRMYVSRSRDMLLFDCSTSSPMKLSMRWCPPVISKSREYFSRCTEKIFCCQWMLHVVDKYPVHNEILSITLHKYCLLTIYHTVFVILHPSWDLRKPSASSLSLNRSEVPSTALRSCRTCPSWSGSSQIDI